MSEPAAKSSSEQDSLLSRLRVPVAVLLAFLLMVGAYYALHYRENAENLSNRNFRLLATLGKQVRDAVRNEGLVVSNVVRPPGAPGAVQMEPQSLNPPITVRRCAPIPGRYPEQITDEDRGDKTGDKVRLWSAVGLSDGAYRVFFNSDRIPGPEKTAQCGQVELKQLLDPLFSSRQAFSAVLLANSAGKVVYLNGPKSLQVQQLDLLIENRHDTREKPEKDGKAADKAFNAFQGYSGAAEVRLGDRLYTAFVQPFSLPLASVEADRDGHRQEVPHDVWLLAGLVANDELAAKSLALSPSSVAFLLGILLLAALAWPLAKLKLLGERQRVKKTDVLLVAVCSLLGVSVATLFVLDLGAYRTLKSSSEVQLQDFAEQMESNLLVEIRRAYDQLCELEQRRISSHSPPADYREAIPLPADYLGKSSYPFFESFALIDDKGEQVFKWTNGASTPLIKVADRLYFQQVHQGSKLSIPEPEFLHRRSEPFFLESVQSWTNGHWQAVIAKPADQRILKTDPSAQVAALAIQMLSVIKPIAPPDFEFAVVGDDGTVLFHSDSARNLAENFFEETDHDRRFRSIVFARHDESLDLRYWGEKYRAFAIPVKGLPWTIVAMQKQQVLERVNLDWLVTTLILVLLYTSAITLVLIAVTRLRPGYQTAWIWPDPDRRHDYARLLVVLGIFCAAFLIALCGLRGTGFLFGVAALLPGLSLVIIYLMLRPVESRDNSKGGIEACGVLLFALLCLTLGLTPDASLWVRRTVLVLVACACLLAVYGPRRWRGLQASTRLPVSRSYPALGLLLVFLTAVMPTFGFFKVAHRLQVDTFVRNGQLKMAKFLHEQADLPDKKTPDGVALVASSLTITHDLGNKPSLDFYGGTFFNTVLNHDQPDPKSCEQEDELLSMLLPPYSDYTAESRQLSRTQTSDNDWSWCGQKGEIFFKGDYLKVRFVSKVEPAWRGNGPFLAMAGLLPPREPIDLVEKTNREPVTPDSPDITPAKDSKEDKETWKIILGQALRGLLASIVLSSFGILLYILVIFVARHIFLFDVQKPLWGGRAGDLTAMVGANLLLISRTQKWPIKEQKGFCCMSFRDLDEDNGLLALRLKLVRDLNPTVLVANFEHHAFDPAWNERKLALLEEIVFIHQRTVVVLSELSPAVLFSPTGLPADPVEGRWRTLLALFTQIDGDVWPRSQKEIDIAGSRRSPLRYLWDVIQSRWRRTPRSLKELPGDKSGIRSRLLRRECGEDLFLNRIGNELDSYDAPDEQVLEELGECAQGYYGAIWASCSPDERVVLGHLAEEGLVNAKSRRVVRRLMARGLIQRAPNFRLMNETFRRFVVSPGCREQVLDLEQKAGRSTWDRFHWPFSIGLAACAALILVTQQELLDSTVATVTGVTAGLPTLLKLLDLLGWKRGGKSA